MSSLRHKFITEPIAGLKCIICHEVAMEPWQHGKCGRLFCRKCLEVYGRDKPCHHCNDISPQYFEDNKSKGDISVLQVKCKYADKNCPWRGTVDTLSLHLDVHCEYRDHECNACGEKGTYAYIMQSHDKVCKKKHTPCPNNCDKTIQRQSVKKHLEYCPMEEVSCKYAKLGCSFRAKRKDMGAHEENNDKLHLHMALNATVQLQDLVSKLESIDLSPFTFQVTQYKKKKERKKVFTSPSFYTSPNGYHMTIEVHANGYADGEATHISVVAVLMKGKNDSKLKWPFQGKIAFTLMNQLENTNHFETTLTVENRDDVQVGSKRGYSTFIRFSDLVRDTVRNMQYLKDDTLYFRVAVDLASYKPWLECTAK